MTDQSIELLDPVTIPTNAGEARWCTARVTAVAEVEMGRELDFELPPELAPYVAEKGSIAVDGVSLTVTRVHERPDTCGVALIPHTLEHTIAGQYVPGTLVNVEVDVVARYVARLIGRPAEATR